MRPSGPWPVCCRRAGSQRHILVTSVLVLLLACVSLLAPRAAAPGSLASPGEAAMVTDEDGVQMLYPSAPGSWYRLGVQDPNRAPGFTIEHHTPATAHVEGALHYWNVPSYALTYASGGTGGGSRPPPYCTWGPPRRISKKPTRRPSSPPPPREHKINAHAPQP